MTKFIVLSRLLNNKLLWRTAIYTLSSSFGALVAFLLLPVLTRYLSPYDYGVVETFTAVTACLTGIALMGGSTLLSKDFFGLNAEAVKIRISEQICVIGIVGAIIGVTIFVISIFSEVIEDIIKLDSRLVILAVGVSVSNALISLLTTVFQLEKKTLRYSVFVNLKTVTDMLTSIFLIVYIGYAWEGRILGLAGSTFLFLFVSFIILHKYGVSIVFPIRRTFSLALIGLPLMLAHVTGWAMEMIDKLMINHFMNLESTGLYSIGYRFGMVVMMIEIAFSRAWLPFFYEKIQSDTLQSKLSIVKATYFYVIVLLIITLAFGLGGKYLLYFMVDESYHKAGEFVLLISIGYFFDGVWKVFIGYLIHLDKINVYSYVVGLSAMLNIFSNYMLLPRVGLIGAAWATSLSFAFGAILTITIALKSYKMPWFYFIKD